MKKAILFLTLCTGFAVAQTATVGKAAPKAAPKATTPAKPAAPIAQPLVIPKDAVAQPEGTYKYTDKQGRHWVFSNTPFGVSRMEDVTNPNAPAAEKQAPSFDKFTEDSDVIHFERQSPFGSMKWDRKKSELSEEERQAIANFKPAEKK
jgi:hypothetical protein